ncbi:RCC1-like domain-containing protein [Mumia sp. Pv 4-285]|uniref:RCC1-like domain-containing protein n=1 Tax=Mumia qirimensis TaxID=3234852 RepID=UPI00351CDB2B
MKTLVRRGGAGLAASALVAGAFAALPPASNAAVPPEKAGKVAAWGTGTETITVPESLNGKVVTAVAAGNNVTLAVADGTVTPWGVLGQAPLVVPEDLSGVVDVAVGTSNAAALKADGSIVAWGADFSGINTVPADATPAKSVEVGGTLAFSVKTDGTVKSWGSGAATPANVIPDGLANVTEVAAGAVHQLALQSDGHVVGWGNSALPAAFTIPDAVQGHVTQIAAGNISSALVTDDGKVTVLGTLASAPQPAGLADETVVDVDVTGSITALTASGKVYSWGGAPALNEVPPSLEGAPVSAIAAGATHNVALVTTLHALVDPTISGTAKVGQTLAATPATFTLDPGVTTQWLANGVPIAGATGTTLALTTAHVGKRISVSQTATKGEDAVTATSGQTAAVVPATVSSRLTASAATVRYGTAPQVQVNLAPHNATGTVEVRKGSALLGRASVRAGRATVVLSRTALGPGHHVLNVRYIGDATTTPSTFALRLNVAKANAKVATRVKTKKIVAKKTKAKIAVTVRATGVRAGGTVAVYRGKKKIGTARLKSNGTAVVTLKKLKKAGKTKLTIRYLGSSTINKATKTIKVKIRKR